MEVGGQFNQLVSRFCAKAWNLFGYSITCSPSFSKYMHTYEADAFPPFVSIFAETTSRGHSVLPGEGNSSDERVTIRVPDDWVSTWLGMYSTCRFQLLDIVLAASLGSLAMPIQIAQA